MEEAAGTGILGDLIQAGVTGVCLALIGLIYFLSRMALAAHERLVLAAMRASHERRREGDAEGSDFTRDRRA